MASQERGQKTTFVISELLSISITITASGYSLESHGRRIEGPAPSIGAAKQAALATLRDMLGRGMIDMEAALKLR